MPPRRSRSHRSHGSSVPAPLPLAIIVATFIALRGAPTRTLPVADQADDDARPIAADDRVADRIVGTVGGPVLTTAHGFGAPLTTSTTTIWLWTTEPVEPGDRVDVIGRLRTPRGFLDPGNPDRAALVAARGAEWELTATRVSRLGRDDSVRAAAWRWAASVQRRWSDRIEASEQDTAARSALTGIVTGDRTDVPEDLDARWRAVGIYHVLSVSGLHLAVVAGLAFFLLSRLVAMLPFGGRTRPARWAGLVAIGLAVAYTLVTGGQLATVRALIVVTVVLGGKMLDRPLRLVDSLGFAAIVILIWRPQDLFDPSFQLSFVAAFTLALRPTPTALALTRSRVRRWLTRGLATSAWVSLATAPITALHFHQVAAGGVIGNLVLTPVVELVALPLGFAGVVVGDLWEAAGAALIDVSVWIVARVDEVAGVLAKVVPVGNVAVASPLLVIAMVSVTLWLAARQRRSRADVVAWLALCVMWGLGRVPAPSGSLRVTFLDVGQGDAAIVETPGGHVWLVDAGGVASARTLESASAPGRAITRTLEVYGHDAIDLAIISHPHPDHYLGLAALDLPVRELWFVDDDDATDRVTPRAGARAAMPGFRVITRALELRGTRVVRPALGTLRSDDGVELIVWAPQWEPAEDAPIELAADPVRSVNDNSLVVAVSYGGRTILFTGDLEVEGEEALVAAGVGRVDVVKVPHHGSPTSSSAALVEATAPEVAVVSCGVANQFGFPSEEVLARWRGIGARVQRTDLDGAVTVTVGMSGGLEVSRFAP